MASSSNSKGVGAYGEIKIKITEVSYSVSGNSSHMRVNLYLINNGNASSYSNSGVNWSISGTKDASGNNTYNVGAYSTKDWIERNWTVGHNSDGSKSVSEKFTLGNTGTYTFGSGGSVSTSLTLHNIPRTSHPSVGDSNINFGSYVTIYTNRASSSFTHNLYYNWDGGSTHTIKTGVGSSYQWTPPNSLMNDIPNKTKATCKITCKTYNGGDYIGSDTVNMTINVPSSVKPSFSSITDSEAVSSVNSTVGKYVQSLSKIHLGISGASGAYGSSIESYKITCDGDTINSSSGTTGTISGSGNITVTATIEDSRGRSYSDSKTISVLSYSKPKIHGLSANRSTSGGTKSTDGTYIRVDLDADVASLVNDSQKNAITYKIETKPTGGSYSTKVNTSPGGISYDSYRVIGSADYSIATSYIVQITVSDKFNTTSTTRTVATSKVPLDISDTGIGAGKVWERGALDVGGDAYVSGKLRLTSTSDASDISTAHPFQIGLDTGVNVAFDNNEIQARNNGSASGLNLNISGGDVNIGNGSSNITVFGGDLVGPWISSGINFSTTSGWSINDYRLRKLFGGKLLQGVIQLGYSGSTITVGAKGNIADVNGIITIPSGYRPTIPNGQTPRITLHHSGYPAWEGRINSDGTIDLTAGSAPDDTLASGDVLYINIDYFID